MKHLIKEIRIEDRPRERLEKHGANSLSNYELLAILLRTGYKDVSAIMLSQDLLLSISNLQDLSEISISELTKIKGIGKAKAVQIIAAIELGKRINTPFESKFRLNSPKTTYLYFKEEMQNLSQEHLICLYLNSKSDLIDKKAISIGTVNKTLFHPRDILKWAVKFSAVGIILIHNHPSGNPNPSAGDISMTNLIIKAAELIDVKIIDHIIIGKNRFYSFSEKDKI